MIGGGVQQAMTLGQGPGIISVAAAKHAGRG